jgi:Zn-dependent peptidase ImmA (M78 family)
MSVLIKGREFILIDNKVRTDSAQERVHLAHEIGHCLTGAYYAIGADKVVREKAENRAKAWTIVHLLPKDAFYERLRQGYNEWEIAEEFNITVELVRDACQLYRKSA